MTLKKEARGKGKKTPEGPRGAVRRAAKPKPPKTAVKQSGGHSRSGKEAEEALRKRKATLRSIFRAAPVGIGLLVDRVIIQANNRLCEMVGYSPEELIGQSSHMLYPTDEEFELVGRAKYEQIRERGTGTVETRWMRNDGEVIDVLLSSTPLDPSDLSIGVTFTALDITDRKRAEKKLRAANEELRQAYEGLKKAQETAIAQEKLAAVGRLMAGVSHEIMSPLNAISLFIHVHLDDPEVSPELAEDLKAMRYQVERIAKLAKNLLYTARQRKPERGPVDLNELVRKSRGLVEHDLRYKNVAVEMELEEGLEPLFADHDQMHQVVLNLLSNARDATPQGGRITLRTAKLDTLPGSDRALVELRVEDTGEGIAAKSMEKLFEPFFTTKPEGKGTGLGLSICRGIVEAHGGKIWAENVDGGGAAFVVQLPLGAVPAEG